MLDSTATLEQLQEQQRVLSQALKEAWDREAAELNERAAKLGLALVPADQVVTKRGRKPRQQQEPI